ncbi:drug/metabolite transporter (DMT)-like permease [Paraburkholderia youngii]|uniref:DMT family transporter n=1 Tax=Paraburkholderia youngii TaxID=2782701 RepID=UPI003D2084C5
MMIFATALWAFALIAPLLLSSYTPVEITLSRYLWYGVVSLVLLLARYRARRLSVPQWCRAAAYALAGNILVSILVSFAVQDTGAEVVIPIVGFLPVCVSLAGSRTLPAAKWLKLILPFCVFVVGLAIVLFVESNHDGRQSGFSWRGVAAVLATVLIWTWYAISNEDFLRRNRAVSGTHWSCAVGVMTLLLSSAFIAVGLAHGGAAAFHSHSTEQTLALFVVVTLALGVGTSWLATSLFNYASHSLPMGLVGQLLILETVFGIAYTCVYHQSLPQLSQAVGTLLVLVGIWFSARVLLK